MYDGADQRRDTEIFARGLAHDGTHGRLVVILQAAAQSVGQKLFGDRVLALVAIVRHQDLLQPGRFFNMDAAGAFAARPSETPGRGPERRAETGRGPGPRTGRESSTPGAAATRPRGQTGRRRGGG